MAPPTVRDVLSNNTNGCENLSGASNVFSFDNCDNLPQHLFVFILAACLFFPLQYQSIIIVSRHYMLLYIHTQIQQVLQ